MSGRFMARCGDKQKFSQQCNGTPWFQQTLQISSEIKWKIQ